jgi:hypothetical protein
MITDLRRSNRMADYLPLLVYAIDGINGSRVAGPFSGRIIDISKHGACLLMTQVLRDNHHIFYSTREDSSQVLQLHIHLPPDISNFSITAVPIWMSSFRKEDISAFKMGIEFLTSPEGKQMKRLQQALGKKQKQRGAWWQRNSA